MSFPSNLQGNTSRAAQAQSAVSFNRYEYARQVINKQIETLKEEMNRTEIEWLNLCNLTQQSKTGVDPKKTEPLFKNADELNAVPLPINLDTNDNSNHTPQDHEDEEFSDDD